MFTGLIEEVGLLRASLAENEGARLRIEARLAGELARGESVAIDGTCLTVETHDSQSFTVFASDETLRRTTLGSLAAGSPVNLERALAMGARLGGHWVQGHVDGTGILRNVVEQPQSHVVTFAAPDSILRFLVEKGSVAIDGISLTVASLEKDSLAVWIIPETWAATTLSRKRPGDRVNVECDLIAKYVFRYLDLQASPGPDSRARDEALEALLRQGGWSGRDPSRGA